MDNESKLRALQKMMEGQDRMANDAELKHLQLGRDKPLAASLKERKGLSTGGAIKEVDPTELAERMKSTPSIQDLSADRNLGSKVASKSQLASLKRGAGKVEQEAAEGIFSKLASKVGSKGIGKVAGIAAGLPLMLASEAADASEVGESALDDDMMIAEAGARKDYKNSQASYDKQGIERPYQELTFPQMRALKDGRREDIREGQKGDAGLREMVDIREDIRDVAGSDMSMEEKERLAQKQLDETRKKKGLSHSPIMQNQGEDL